MKKPTADFTDDTDENQNAIQVFIRVIRGFECLAAGMMRRASVRNGEEHSPFNPVEQLQLQISLKAY